MVIIPERKLIFIHIPRTSGMSFSLALDAVFPSALIDLGETHIHDRHPSLPGYDTFTIMRSPWELYESHFKWCVLVQQHGFRECEPHVIPYVRQQVRRGFEQAVLHAIRQESVSSPPGFFHTYCFPHTQVFLSQREAAAFLGIHWEIPVVNDSPAADLTWSDHLIQVVGEHCADDVSRFGFRPPTKNPRRIRPGVSDKLRSASRSSPSTDDTRSFAVP